jgi:hypothetical protein
VTAATDEPHTEEKVTRPMYHKPYELGSAADGYRLRVRARGNRVLSNRY